MHHVLRMTAPLSPVTGEAYCKEHFGTSLGSVHSKVENDAIASILRGYFDDFGNTNGLVGLYRDGSSYWNWGDRTGNHILDPNACFYNNWRKGEPDVHENCAGITPGGDWEGCYAYSLSLSFFF